MSRAIKKYNPGFLTEEELIASFCVRVPEYKVILESLQTWAESSSPHTLVIGPRGSGKTHLLLRTVAEIHRDPDLNTIFPVLFAEESYEISTCGEFWLEALGHLAEQAPAAEQERLKQSYGEIQATQDDKTLALRSLGVLLDFADGHHQRLLLVVENLNMLFADMADADAGWQLRHTLQTEPRILLLGSATSRFAEIDCPDHALYDLFRVIALHPLDTEDCQVLWQSVCQQEAAQRAIRPLEILTGGNPRLLTIIAHFSSRRSFRELMGNLVDLVDDHTEYFKSHLETLPPQERRVYLALARLWKPATTKEIAGLARLDTNKCSSLLKRLVGRGVVVATGGTRRRPQYYLTERLYNIYYLMRRSRGTERMVKALIDFMICLYAPVELGEILEEASVVSHGSEIILSDIAPQMAEAMLEEAVELSERGLGDEAVAVCDQIVQKMSQEMALKNQIQVVFALLLKTHFLYHQGRYNESMDVCKELELKFGKRTEPVFLRLVAEVIRVRGNVLLQQSENTQALEAYNQALDLIQDNKISQCDFFVALTICHKGIALFRNMQFPEAICAFNQVFQSYGQSVDPYVAYATTASLIWKSIISFMITRNVSENDLSLLLTYLAKQRESSPPPNFMLVMSLFLTKVSPHRTLELILASPAASLLLPLVTALQQMMGEEPRVAKEVEEVAADIRHSLEHHSRLFHKKPFSTAQQIHEQDQNVFRETRTASGS